MRETRGTFQGLLGCLALGLCVSALVLATGAAAGTPEAVTITADEFFPASGTPTISIHASGGMFGAGINGSGVTEQVVLGSETAYFRRRAVQYHGVDVYTTAAGAITFKWQFNCMFTSFTDSTCTGPWHITDATGAYTGAQGGGTAVDLCVDEYAGDTYTGTACDDTLTGKVQVP
jgi:hypothetical protein